MYVAPAYRDDPLAVEWEEYLEAHCDWCPSDFGHNYAWEAPIPPREQWAEEVAALNDHLNSL